MFMSIYTSEFNRESWDRIANEWSYDQFIDHVRRVIQISSLREAQQKDQKAMSKKNNEGYQ